MTKESYTFGVDTEAQLYTETSGMTDNKRFTIDVETENFENAYFEDDKFLCYEDDYDAILNRLNELAEENNILKKDNTELKKRLFEVEKEKI